MHMRAHTLPPPRVFNLSLKADWNRTANPSLISEWQALLFSASPSSYWKPGWLVVFKWRDSDAFWSSHFGTEYPFIHCHCSFVRPGYLHRDEKSVLCQICSARGTGRRFFKFGSSETSSSAEITQQLYQRKQPWLCYSRLRIWLVLQFVSSVSMFLWCFLLNIARTPELLAAVLHGQASAPAASRKHGNCNCNCRRGGNREGVTSWCFMSPLSMFAPLCVLVMKSFNGWRSPPKNSSVMAWPAPAIMRWIFI